MDDFNRLARLNVYIYANYLDLSRFLLRWATMHLTGLSVSIRRRSNIFSLFAETKGTLDSEEFRGIENGKISCTKKLLSSIRSGNIHYEHVSTYQNLIDRVMK